MTKIAISPNVSGTGTFTLTAPDSNTNRTLTLPDEAGTVLSSVSNIEAQVKTATNATGTAPIYACRAWVNFNGTGTVAIRASGNVSSVTRNGTGIYTINFSSTMPDANYAVSVSNGRPSPSFDGQSGYLGTPSVNSVQVYGINNGDTAFKDFDYFSVAIFR